MWAFQSPHRWTHSSSSKGTEGRRKKVEGFCLYLHPWKQTGGCFFNKEAWKMGNGCHLGPWNCYDQGLPFLTLIMSSLASSANRQRKTEEGWERGWAGRTQGPFLWESLGGEQPPQKNTHTQLPRTSSCSGSGPTQHLGSSLGAVCVIIDHQWSPLEMNRGHLAQQSDTIMAAILPQLFLPFPCPWCQPPAGSFPAQGSQMSPREGRHQVLGTKWLQGPSGK